MELEHCSPVTHCEESVSITVHIPNHIVRKRNTEPELYLSAVNIVKMSLREQLGGEGRRQLMFLPHPYGPVPEGMSLLIPDQSFPALGELGSWDAPSFARVITHLQ